MPDGPWADLPNTAGEPERERKSRQYNLIEGIGVMIIILVSLWWIAYPFGVLMGWRAADAVSRSILGGLFPFVLLISPWLHGDTAASRGLGSPRWVWRVMTLGHGRRRLGFALLIGALTLLMTIALYRNAPGAARFLLGIPPEIVLAARESDGGRALSFLACLLLGALWTTCVFRYDNFLSALAVAGKILAALLPVILILALAFNGTAAFTGLDVRAHGRGALGYVFWGAIQQLLFCGYFGTRLRKGFAPADEPGTFPWRRLLVAVLNGLFFGLIHINSWSLVVATWILGTFLSWAFMEDRGRNLFALGIVHGVLGSCTSWLFSRTQELHVRMRVGPWWMSPPPDPVTLAVASIIIVGLCVFVLAVLRGRRRGEDPR
ncbi:MAG TPA: CPBP family glutamic-type intramembrane protease [Verrucomicrobiae bacterium]|nr:CPBP family glutamic-type intramembrane protease [Verrucomicrobiae bacterium]